MVALENIKTITSFEKKQIIILKDLNCGDYIVTDPSKNEAYYYFTDNKQDAIDTAKYQYPDLADNIRIRSVRIEA